MSTDTSNPTHYSRWKIEPIEFIRANKLDALRANIIKYIMRYDAKDGAKDLAKAQRYLDYLKEDWATGIKPIETPFLKAVSGTFVEGATKPLAYRMQVSYPIVEPELIAAERALYDEWPRED